jgi:hypothetical protein
MKHDLERNDWAVPTALVLLFIWGLAELADLAKGFPIWRDPGSHWFDNLVKCLFQVSGPLLLGFVIGDWFSRRNALRKPYGTCHKCKQRVLRESLMGHHFGDGLTCPTCRLQLDKDYEAWESDMD